MEHLGLEWLGCWDSKPGSLEKQQGLLTANPSVQPLPPTSIVLFGEQNWGLNLEPYEN